MEGGSLILAVETRSQADDPDFGVRIGSVSLASRYWDISAGTADVPGKVIESIPYQSPQEAQNTNLGQHNLLLVLVNNLQQPKLEGVWLVVNGNLNNGSKFLPVEFPAEVQTSGVFSGAMLIEDGGAPARKFVDELIRRGLWWDYYLILDEAGLAAFTE